MKKKVFKESNKRKAGRPKAKIDWEKVSYYLKYQCSAVGIASIMGISVDTLYLRCKQDNKIDFTEFSRQKKDEGKELLRANQFKLAMQGNVPMNIWLGKQYLEQKDKQETDHKNSDGSLKQTNIIVTTNEAKEELKKLMDG